MSLPLLEKATVHKRLLLEDRENQPTARRYNRAFQERSRQTTSVDNYELNDGEPRGLPSFLLGIDEDPLLRSSNEARNYVA